MSEWLCTKHGLMDGPGTCNHVVTRNRTVNYLCGLELVERKKDMYKRTDDSVPLREEYGWWIGDGLSIRFCQLSQQLVPLEADSTRTFKYDPPMLHLWQNSLTKDASLEGVMEAMEDVRAKHALMRGRTGRILRLVEES